MDPNYPRDFTIKITGDSEDDILFALDEIRRQVSEGFLSGFGSNETGCFGYESQPSPSRESDDAEGAEGEQTEETLIAQYGKWGEHERFSRSDWSAETVAGDTSLGYWGWVIQQLDLYGDENESDEPED